MNTERSRYDHRDHYLLEHMRRRKEVAARYSLVRQLACARHLIWIANKQKRILLLVLAVQWEREILNALESK